MVEPPDNQDILDGLAIVLTFIVAVVATLVTWTLLGYVILIGGFVRLCSAKTKRNRQMAFALLWGAGVALALWWGGLLIWSLR